MHLNSIRFRFIWLTSNEIENHCTYVALSAPFCSVILYIAHLYILQNKQYIIIITNIYVSQGAAN